MVTPNIPSKEQISFANAVLHLVLQSIIRRIRPEFLYLGANSCEILVPFGIRYLPSLMLYQRPNGHMVI